jgi:hypothetical protein
MNFLDYLVNAMTGGQPTQQELMMRKMAQQGLLGDPNSVVRESEMKRYDPNSVLRESEIKMYDPNSVVRESEMRITPQIMQQYIPTSNMKYDPNSVLRESEIRQNFMNPGRTMQQNYIDPRLIEQMYYRGLLSK